MFMNIKTISAESNNSETNPKIAKFKSVKIFKITHIIKSIQEIL